MKGNLKYLTAKELERFPTLFHAFLTRLGSAPLNLCGETEDPPALIAEEFPFSPADLLLTQQVHGATVLAVAEEDMAKIRQGHIPADAMVTNLKHLPLAILTADCLPIILFDPAKEVIGIAHVGWRGLLLRLPQKTIESMVKNFHCQPKEIKAALGPAIGPCCYYLGETIARQFHDHFPYFPDFSGERKEGGFWIDLTAAGSLALVEAGLQKENIYPRRICTCCHQELFFSYRGSGANCGRQLSLVMLKPANSLCPL